MERFRGERRPMYERRRPTYPSQPYRPQRRIEKPVAKSKQSLKNVIAECWWAFIVIVLGVISIGYAMFFLGPDVFLFMLFGSILILLGVVFLLMKIISR